MEKKIEFTEREKKETEHLKRLLTVSNFFANSANVTTLIAEAKKAFRPGPKNQSVERLYKSGSSITFSVLSLPFLIILL